MRHRVKGRKFGRKRGARRAFMRTLLGNFIMRERITTTEARAKEIKGDAEKFITLAKRRGGSVFGYRLLLRRLPKNAAQKLNKELRERYRERAGGYTRIIKTGLRRTRDAAKTAIIEFV